jgi:hypothetical protein
LAGPFDPLFGEIQATTVNEFLDAYVYQNSYIATPFQRQARASGAYNPFVGGALMQVPSIYAGAQGGFIAPGTDVTLNRTQMITASAFQPKLCEKHVPIEEFSLEVLNTGPNARIGILEVYLEQMIEGIDFDIEISMFRHGQGLSAGVSDDRTNFINGMSEAINDGVTPSWDGNVFPTYGSSTRNGAIGASINSTPVWLGDASGNPAPPSYQQLLKLYKLAIGRPNHIQTSYIGYTAIAAAFQRQQRYDIRDNQDINWSGIKFEDATIYDDDITPSSNPKPSIANLEPGAGSIQTGTFVLTTAQTANSGISNLTAAMAGTTITVGEPIWMLDMESWEYRPAATESFNYKFMDAIRWPQNPTMYSQFLRHSLNWYCPTPRRNVAGYGIKG